MSKFIDDRREHRATVVLRGRCYEQESVPYKALDSLVDALAQLPVDAAGARRRRCRRAHVRGARAGVPGAGARRRAGRRPPSSPPRAICATSAGTRSPRCARFSGLAARSRWCCASTTCSGAISTAPRCSPICQAAGRAAAAPAARVPQRVPRHQPVPARAGAAAGSDRPDHARAPRRRRRADARRHAMRSPRRCWAARPSRLEDAVDWVVARVWRDGRSSSTSSSRICKSGAAVGARPRSRRVLWHRVTRLPDAAGSLLEVDRRRRTAGAAARTRRRRGAARAAARGRAALRAGPAGAHDRTHARTTRSRRFTIAFVRAVTTRTRPRRPASGITPPSPRRSNGPGTPTPKRWRRTYEGAGEPERASAPLRAAPPTHAVDVLAFDRAEALSDARRRCASESDRARIHERMIHFYTDMARFDDAYAIARAARRTVSASAAGAFIPPLFLIDFAEARIAAARADAGRLARPADGTDGKLEVAIRLMNAVAKAAYQIRPELCVAVATKIVNLCLRHGNTPDCAIGYMVFGAIFHGGVLGQPSRSATSSAGSRSSLVERYRQRAPARRGAFRRRLLRHLVAAAGRARPRRCGRSRTSPACRPGDLFHTGCACAGTTMSYFMRGVPLDDDLGQSHRSLSRMLGRHRLREPIGVVTAVRQAIRNLRGETPSATSLDDDGFDEAAFVAGLATYGSRHFAHMYFIVKMQLLYLRGEYDAALDVASRSAAYCKDSPGMLHVADHVPLSRARLAALAIGRRASWPARRRGSGSGRRNVRTTFSTSSQILEARSRAAAGRRDGGGRVDARARERDRGDVRLHAHAGARRPISSAALSPPAAADAERAAARVRSSDAYRRWGATCGRLVLTAALLCCAMKSSSSFTFAGDIVRVTRHVVGVSEAGLIRRVQPLAGSRPPC